MKEISILTPEQLLKLPEYVDKWIRIGLSTEQVSLSEAQEISDSFMSLIMKRKSVPVILCPDPLTAYYLSVIVNNESRHSVKVKEGISMADYIRKNMCDTFGSHQAIRVLSASMSESIGNSVDKSIESFVRREIMDIGLLKSLRSQLFSKPHCWKEVHGALDQMFDSVRRCVDESVLLSIEHLLAKKLLRPIWRVRGELYQELCDMDVRCTIPEDVILDLYQIMWCQNCLGSLDFLYNETNLSFSEVYRRMYGALIAITRINSYFPGRKVVCVSQNPTQLHLNENNELHKDGGPALVYGDGSLFSMYALWGFNCSRELAETPAENLSIELFTKEVNADKRMLFVRKYGIERMLESHGKIVETWEEHKNPPEWWCRSGYELWDMGSLFPDQEYQPYLKMTNPTTGVFHLEAVSPKCRNLHEALKERFGGRELDIVAQA